MQGKCKPISDTEVGRIRKIRESKHEWGVGFEGKSDPLLRKATASPVVVVQFEQSQVGCA